MASERAHACEGADAAMRVPACSFMVMSQRISVSNGTQAGFDVLIKPHSRARCNNKVHGACGGVIS
jgi:hypothetical protein